MLQDQAESFLLAEDTMLQDKTEELQSLKDVLDFFADCYDLQWHRLPSKQKPIKRHLISMTLSLPNDLLHLTVLQLSGWICTSRVPAARGNMT